MKYSCSFYLEVRIKNKDDENSNLPINLSVTFNGTRLQYYTGYRCTPKQWLIEKTASGEKIQKLNRNVITPDGFSSADINRKLEIFKLEVGKIFDHNNALNIETTRESLTEELNLIFKKRIKKQQTENVGFFERLEQYIAYSTFSDGRKRHFKSSMNKLKSFNPKTTFEKIDVQYLIDYQNFLLQNCNLSPNTVTGELKYLRAFVKHAYDVQNWTQTYSFKNFSITPEVYGDPIYLTIQERDHIYEAELKSPHLERARDIYILHCLIGCRVGDLLKFTKANIIDGAIEYIAQKSKDKTPRIARVPLTEKAKAIIAKYNIPDGKLLPFISEQNYRKYIKKVFLEVGITRIVTILDPKTRLGKQVPINKIAASHMARRVFCGILYEKGVDQDIITSMSGHVPGSKSLRRYKKVSERLQNEAIKLIE